MPKANPLSAQQIKQLIEEDIRTRVLAMISQGLDEDLVRSRFESEIADRVVSSMNWSRLLLGRMFLEFLEFAPKRIRDNDVTITELGGDKITPGSPSVNEWKKIVEFFGHSDKIAHLTMARGRSSEVSVLVNETIPIIVKVLEQNLYKRLGLKSPVPRTYRKKFGLPS